MHIHPPQSLLPLAPCLLQLLKASPLDVMCLLSLTNVL